MNINLIRGKTGFSCDMDGVIYHGKKILPGVAEFINWLKAENKKFLFLTNSSQSTPRELREKLARLGLDVEENHFYTSAMACAAFLASQLPGGSVFVIGDPALTNALYDAGFSMNDISPDYVVVGETYSYTYDRIVKAVLLVRKGARLIGANPDLTGPTEAGIIPATGSLIAPIELASGVKAYFTGKPNPLIMRNAIAKIGCRREDTVIIGDRMDTDIICGIEAGIDTVLVLTGVTAVEELAKFAYRPGIIFNNVGEIAG